MLKRLAGLGVLFMASALPLGCTVYVNIPANAGDVALHDANWETVQDVEIVAVRAAIAEHKFEGPFQVVLAPGSTPATYDRVLPKISQAAQWSKDGPREDAPVIEVREIHIRGSHAQVDVTRPFDPADPKSFTQLVSMEMSWDEITEWRADRVTAWRMNADKALRTKPYEPAPEVPR